MGFLDKAKSQIEQVAKQGQDKMDEMQAKKKADGLLRDLGAWYYATQTGRDNGQGPAEIARLGAELQAHEAEHGQLGGSADEAPAPPAPASAPPVVPPPAAAAPPPPPAAPAPPAPAGEAPPPPPVAPPPPAPAAPAPPAPPATDVPEGGFTLDDL